jgi:hypothetical protein
MQKRGSVSMSKDQRKKIVSISQELGGIEVVSQTDVLFPCNMFEIALPVFPKGKLNIFEETVLRLLQLGSSDKEQLAETTTLEQELIAFILNRLQNIGYLDKHNKLTDKGNSYFEKKTETKELKRIKMFVELNTGKVLPMIYPQDVSATYSQAFNKDGQVSFSSGTVAKSKKVWAYFIDEDKNLGYKNISVKDVLQATGTYEKRHQQYRILHRNDYSFTSAFENTELISINEMPELIYLHCIAVVQKTSGDVFITDGFGFGFSQIFKEVLQQNRPELLQKIKQQGEQHRIGQEEKREEIMMLAGFSQAVDQYPEIVNRIRQASWKWKDIINTEIGSNAETKRNDALNEYLKLMYDLLEWTFRYVVNETHTLPIPAYIFQENGGKFLKQCATKIGINISQKFGSLLNVNAGAVVGCQNGKQTVMEPLLAIMIYDASIDSTKRHPLFQLNRSENNIPFESRKDTEQKQLSEWKKRHSFLEFIAALKPLRDEVRHRGKSEKIVSKDDIEIIRDKTYRIVKEIMPVLKGKGIEIKIVTQDTDINQSYLKAQNKLESYFGYNEFRSIDRIIKDLLEKIEITLEEKLQTVSADIINNFAAIIQRVLFLQYRSGIVKLTEKNGNHKEIALNSARDAGFELRDGNFGSGMKTVQKEFIEKAIKGGNKSIGSNLYAFLINTDKTKLQEIAEKIPELITLTEELHTKSGHGNKTETFPLEIVNELKQAVYKTVKILQEIS